jgi:hypothetical protein
MKQILIDLLKVMGIVIAIVMLVRWLNIADDLAIVLIAVSSVFIQDFYDGLLFLYRKIANLFK